MERKDFELDGMSVDRLTALKAVATDFVEKRAGDRIGLVLFGEGALSAAPVSFDLSALANAISEAEIGMVGRTTAIGEAIGLALVKLRDDPAAEKTVILLSDGTNNAGRAEPEDAARLAAKLSVRIHTIGMGSAPAEAAGPIHPSADLDEATLKRVAQETGGRFFRARTTAELAAVYAEIDRLETSEAVAPPIVPRTDLRNVALVALALLLLALATREARGARA
jgi:Ca-activated chloride channel family protein